MGYACGGDSSWLVYKAIVFILGTFVFSYIFWSTKIWLEKKPKRKK